MNEKYLNSHLGLTVNVSIFSGTNGVLFFPSGPRICNGLNSHSLTGQDHQISDQGAHPTKEFYYDGTH